MSDEDVWPGENLSPILLLPVDWKATYKKRRAVSLAEFLAAAKKRRIDIGLDPMPEEENQ